LRAALSERACVMRTHIYRRGLPSVSRKQELFSSDVERLVKKPRGGLFV
jgi:hypothetical protein